MNLKVYLAYDNANSIFAERLEADFLARNFQVNTSANGYYQSAIDAANLVLLPISPQSIVSAQVIQECQYALGQNSLIIPIKLQDTLLPESFAAIGAIQMVDFLGDYKTALQNLLYSIAFVDPQVRSSSLPPPPESSDAKLDLVVKAKARGDLERAFAILSHLANYESKFKPEIVRPLLNEITPIVQERWKNQLYRIANEAQEKAQWNKALASYLAITDIDPNDRRARSQATTMQQNKDFAWLYAKADESFKEGDRLTATEYLRQLDQQAPQYGDPLRIKAQLLPKPVQNQAPMQAAYIERKPKPNRNPDREENVRYEKADSGIGGFFRFLFANIFLAIIFFVCAGITSIGGGTAYVYNEYLACIERHTQFTCNNRIEDMSAEIGGIVLLIFVITFVVLFFAARALGIGKRR